jgi:hypothetical protein
MNTSEQEIVTQVDNTPVPNKNASYRLFVFCSTVLIGLLALFTYRTGGDVNMPTLAGLGILIFAFIPALQWTRQNRAWFPAFELFSLSAAAFYAFPLLIGHRDLVNYPPSLVAECGLLVIIFLVSAQAGFNLLRSPVKIASWGKSSLLPEFAYRYIPIGALAHTVYLYIENYTTILNFFIQGTLRAFFFGIGTLCTFVLAKLWGLGALHPRIVTFFCVNLSIQIILQLSQLYLITSISLLAIATIAYASTRRKLPWLLVGLALPTLAILHIGKSDMRAVYWSEGRPRITISELPGFFTDWVTYGLTAKEEEVDSTQKRITIFERASLIQMLCLSVERVPDIKPYLNGESYIDLPAQIIPRFLWPDKPSSLLANVRLAVHFGLVDPDNAMQVSIAFGQISEAYCNFGWAGVALLGFLLGLGFRRVAMLSLQATQFSAVGILMILLTAWSFQAELILITWLTSLFQAAVVCIGVPLIYRQFTTR